MIRISFYKPSWYLIKRRMRFWCQKLTRGWSDEETWNLDDVAAKFILPRLKRFRELNNGFPPNLTAKSWDVMIDKMIFAFDALIKDEFLEDYQERHKRDRKITEGLQIFGKYFCDLWW